jgi:hypothetical protein
LRDHRNRSGLDGLLDKSVTINAFTLDGHKEAPGGYASRIVCDRLHRTTRIASLFQNLDLPMEPREQLRDGDGNARHGL